MYLLGFSGMIHYYYRIGDIFPKKQVRIVVNKKQFNVQEIIRTKLK